jgi:uncharacterized Tic20 family protein
MEAEKQNYGTYTEPETERPTIEEQPRVTGGTSLSEGDERTWASLAHLSMLLNVFTGFLGPVAALALWFYFRDRSQAVAFQALQSAAYQGAWLVAIAAGWGIALLLTIVLIGFLLFPVMALLTLVPLVHAVYAAYRVSKGEDFRYPIIADLIDNR